MKILFSLVIGCVGVFLSLSHSFAYQYDAVVQNAVMKQSEDKRYTYVTSMISTLSRIENTLVQKSRLTARDKKMLDIITPLIQSFEKIKNTMTNEQISKSDTKPAGMGGDQFTPDQANWKTFSTKPMAGSSITSHDPDGIGRLNQASRDKAKRDGTVYNPAKMTPKAFAQAICPSGDQIRGIREVFYQNKPFADNKNPTKAEVDEWHRIAINHLRSLVGYTSPERQIQKDHCLFARALWGDQRKFTTMWDKAYPIQTCVGSTNSHCGATFLPSVEDQKSYLPDHIQSCSAGAGSEGVFNASKSNIPRSIKRSRSFCSALGQEGFWGGHVGPWFHREKFGFSFWDPDPSNNNNNAALRAKRGGKLLPNLYQKP